MDDIGSADPDDRPSAASVVNGVSDATIALAPAKITGEWHEVDHADRDAASVVQKVFDLGLGRSQCRVKLPQKCRSKIPGSAARIVAEKRHFLGGRPLGRGLAG